MVMPCSRSACRPSVISDRSTAVRPRRCEVFSIELSVSARMVLVSNSRRPISVLLPSSTLPQVRKRSRPVSMPGMFSWADMFMIPCGFLVGRDERSEFRRSAPIRGSVAFRLWLNATYGTACSEIAFALALLHRSFRGLVVHARGAALGDRRGGGLEKDLGHGVGV